MEVTPVLKMIIPLSPKSDQRQISPCNNEFVVINKNSEYDHTRRICFIFYHLCPTCKFCRKLIVAANKNFNFDIRVFKKAN